MWFGNQWGRSIFIDLFLLQKVLAAVLVTQLHRLAQLPCISRRFWLQHVQLKLTYTPEINTFKRCTWNKFEINMHFQSNGCGNKEEETRNRHKDANTQLGNVCVNRQRRKCIQRTLCKSGLCLCLIFSSVLQISGYAALPRHRAVPTRQCFSFSSTSFPSSHHRRGERLLFSHLPEGLWL